MLRHVSVSSLRRLVSAAALVNFGQESEEDSMTSFMVSYRHSKSRRNLLAFCQIDFDFRESYRTKRSLLWKICMRKATT